MDDNRVEAYWRSYLETLPADSPEEREKIDLLLSLRLSEVTAPSAPLEQVMRETSEAARRRGLTEKLEH